MGHADSCATARSRIVMVSEQKIFLKKITEVNIKAYEYDSTLMFSKLGIKLCILLVGSLSKKVLVKN